MAARSEGLAQADGGVPVATNPDGAARGGEAGGLTVNGEQDVGVCQDTVVSLNQT